MGWTPLLLEMRDKKVLVVGTGEVGERRAKRFLEAGAHVVILGNTASEEIIELGASVKSIDNASRWVKWSDLVVIATGDHNLNEEIAHLADYKLVNRADYPQKGNLIVPTSFFIEDVQICIFTGGKSPLMAKQLRKKIQKVIKNEDILQLELQDFTRKLLKDKVKDQKDRRSYLYKILNNKTVEKLLKDGNLNQAKIYVEELLLNLNEEA